MTPADYEALVVRAKRIVAPVVNCVQAGIRIGHLTQALSREDLLALIAVLADCADHERVRAVTSAPGDLGMPPAGREDVLRAAHAESMRLYRADLPVPFQVRVLDGQYQQYRARKARAAGEASDAA